MKEIYIWGAGYYADFIYSIIDKNACIVKGLIDSNREKQGALWNDELRIYAPEDLRHSAFEYVIVSVQNYEGIERACSSMGIPEEKVICYWKDSESIGLFESRGARIQKELDEKYAYKRKMSVLEYRLESAPYEWGIKPVPIIRSGEELLKTAGEERKSICRFGDGEFEIMRGKERPWFQNVSAGLQERLLEIIATDHPDIMIAIPQNYVELERYKDVSADIIREYMSHGTREAIGKFLDYSRIYYDAYVTRPYILHKTDETAKRIFPLFKDIWNNQSVLIVEGEYARNGMGNDLFSRASDIRRILCPSKNAWDYYEKIKECILQNVKEEDVTCISLGPTATVLTYDLAKAGYWTIDIGQLDNEYDWFLMKAEDRVDIPGKMVAEFHNEEKILLFEDVIYDRQIIARIGC